MSDIRLTESTANALAALSALPQADFIVRLGDIFEHSPWVPERAWASRPFASIDALHAAMVAVVDAASEAEQLALICAHPELAGKEAAAGTLTAHSTKAHTEAGNAAVREHNAVMKKFVDDQEAAKKAQEGK